MDKVEQLKELLKELTPEEVEQFKAFLNADVEEPPREEVSATDEVATETTTDGGDKAEEVKDAPPEEEKVEEVAKDDEVPSEPAESPKEEESPQEEPQAEPVEEVPQEQLAEPQEEPSTPPEDDIPKMQRGVEYSDDDVTETQTITSEDGKDIPIDYEQIVSGLNAKVAALEAENATLRSKVEGAFGYSAKPSMPVKTNRLYDDCSDVHFHK